MAANFWASTQYHRFMYTRQDILVQEKAKLQQISHRGYQMAQIFFMNVIEKIGRRLRKPQEVIATASIYFKRFYVQNEYTDIDPYLMASTCVYLACKVEEVPIRLKTLLEETKTVLSVYGDSVDFKYSGNDISECENYLLEEMEFCLIVFHPYQELINLKSWLSLSIPVFEKSWSIVNDSLRTNVGLVYPPHIIAIAAVFLSKNTTAKSADDSGGGGNSSEWLSGLNVDIADVMKVAQDIIAIYEVWNEYSDLKIPNLLVTSKVV